MTQISHSDFSELELLARTNPVALDDVDDGSSPEASALYARLAARVDRRPPLSRRPRLLAAALATALLLVGGAAVAAVTVGPWWQEGEPPVNPEVVDRQLTPQKGGFPPAADRARARTVARADGAALVAAPVGQSGYCLIPSLPGKPDLGHSCVYQVTDPASGTSDDLRGYARPPEQGTPRWILYGRITDPRAASLDLTAAAGTPFAIALQPGGFFIANVPENRWHALGNNAGRGRILNAAGETLRTGCVNWGPSPHDRGAGEARYPFWSDSAGPCLPRPLPERPTIVLSRAEKLVELTLRNGFARWDAGTTIALWRAPTRSGGECIYVAAAAPTRSDRSPDDPRTMPGGGMCFLGPAPAASTSSAFATNFSWTRSNDGYAVLLDGHVDPAIMRVTLRSAAGETSIPFANGYYLVELGNASDSGTLPPGGPYALVGYNKEGRVVATQELGESLSKLRGG